MWINNWVESLDLIKIIVFVVDDIESGFDLIDSEDYIEKIFVSNSRRGLMVGEIGGGDIIKDFVSFIEID